MSINLQNTVRQSTEHYTRQTSYDQKHAVVSQLHPEHHVVAWELNDITKTCLAYKSTWQVAMHK